MSIFKRVCLCAHKYLQVTSAVCCMCGGQRLTFSVFYHSVHYFLRQALSLNLKLVILARLAEQQVSRICLFLPQLSRPELQMHASTCVFREHVRLERQQHGRHFRLEIIFSHLFVSSLFYSFIIAIEKPEDILVINPLM